MKAFTIWSHPSARLHNQGNKKLVFCSGATFVQHRKKSCQSLLGDRQIALEGQHHGRVDGSSLRDALQGMHELKKSVNDNDFSWLKSIAAN